MTFKYQEAIDSYIEKTHTTLPSLIIPKDKEAFRFVFANNVAKNHLPIFLSSPQRINNPRNHVTGFALSCFETVETAESKFCKLLKSSPNIRKTIGDSLSKGNLSSEDGMITETNTEGHFELFESTTCNLTQTFNVIKAL